MPPTSTTSHAFTPWRENYRHANILAFFGLAWLSIGLIWCAFQPTVLAISFAMLPTAPLYFYFVHREYGSKRKYGLALEKAAVARLIQNLPEGWIGEADIQLPNSSANTDCRVTLPNGHQCVIDVKSWRHLTPYNGTLIRQAKNGRTFDETKQLSRQIWQQIIALKAKHGIVWLPKAPSRPPIIFRRFYVVYGGISSLLDVLSSLNIEHREKSKYVIKFPAAPSEAVRTMLKRAGFRWNTEKYCWTIFLPVAATLPNTLIANVKAAGGSITPPEIDAAPPLPIETPIGEQFMIIAKQIV
jgi:hypothetical protein